ncbi:hypothetical protein ABIC08_007685 [Bradyrhizobium sp. RT9b]|uniref:hypothetical protein n=1 Tax=unclassified Bradyrhizobium TaxID=2631580 RepID=UPI003391CE87
MWRLFTILAFGLLASTPEFASGLIFSDSLRMGNCKHHPSPNPGDPAHAEECTGAAFAIDPDSSEIFACNAQVTWIVVNTTGAVSNIKDTVSCRPIHRPFSDAGDFNFVFGPPRSQTPFEAVGTVVWIGDAKSH